MATEQRDTTGCNWPQFSGGSSTYGGSSSQWYVQSTAGSSATVYAVFSFPTKTNTWSSWEIRIDPYADIPTSVEKIDRYKIEYSTNGGSSYTTFLDITGAQTYAPGDTQIASGSGDLDSSQVKVRISVTSDGEPNSPFLGSTVTGGLINGFDNYTGLFVRGTYTPAAHGNFFLFF